MTISLSFTPSLDCDDSRLCDGLNHLLSTLTAAQREANEVSCVRCSLTIQSDGSKSLGALMTRFALSRLLETIVAGVLTEALRVGHASTSKGEANE